MDIQEIKNSFQNKQDYNYSLPMFTLIKREVKRFISVFRQTVLAPLCQVTLYLLIFGVSLGERIKLSDLYSYMDFIVPGLIFMGAANNSFNNSASSLFMAKYLGYIFDLLISPLSTLNLILAYTFSSIFRGLLVASLIFGICMLFNSQTWQNPVLGFSMLFISCFLFSQLGILAALVSKNFDQLGVFINFVILPAIYIGGMFFPVNQLPKIWQKIAMLNPLYYMIDAFRGSFIGVYEQPVIFSVSLTFVLSIILLSLAVFFLGKKQVLRR